MNSATRTFPPFLKLLICLFLAAQLSAQSSLLILPEEDESTPETHQLVWETEPDVRYEAQQSSDLSEWNPVEGYPAQATSTVDALSFGSDAGSQFFRIVRYDEQAPTIAERIPGADAFAIRRFSELSVSLEDFTGVDPASIALSLGEHGPYTVASPELTFADGVLTLDLGGDTALGDYGATIEVDLTVADPLGNSTTHEWAFDLEVEPVVSEDLFVFGSPQAQRAGQRLRSLPARVLAERQMTGPIRMNAGAQPWEIESVEPDRVVVSYTDALPAFWEGQEIGNLLPASVGEIFYRRVTSMDNDPTAQLLTLFTEDLNSLEDIIDQGSVVIDENSYVLEIGEDGRIIRAIEFDARLDFPQLGYSLDGSYIALKGDGGYEFELGDYSKSVGDGANFLTATAEELHFWLTPYLWTYLEIGFTGLKRLEAGVGGDLDSAIVLDVHAVLADESLELPLFPGLAPDLPHQPVDKRPNFWIYLGQIGPAPIYAQVLFDISLTAQAEAKVELNFRAGMRQSGNLELGIDYEKSREAAIEWIYPTASDIQSKLVPPEKALDGGLGLHLELEPSISFLVYGLAGAEASLAPRGGVVFEAAVLPEPHVEGRFEAEVNLKLGTAGPALEWLELDDLEVPVWDKQWHLFPDQYPLAFLQTPGSRSVLAGSDQTLTASVNRSEGVSYQWYKDGILMPFKNAAVLDLRNVTPYDSAEYTVKVTPVEGDPIISEPAILLVSGVGSPAPSGFSLIPAGSFEMGDSFNEGSSKERPVHTVYVSGFYMAQTETTYRHWQEVYDWAVSNGYSFDNAGSGKGADHPVHTVSWYDVVKWCNAASEREGLGPVYRTSGGGVYRTGQIAPVIEYGNRGYRLPTEAEWEKAARGGLSGKRFPWGDTISHSEANYRADGDRYSYDSSPFTDLRYHPSYDDGGTPYTSPVGSFGTNGYGLYDMAGNLWEWCNDWYASSYYSSSPGSDPAGPSSGTNRVGRGGGWGYGANYCRSADRNGGNPGNRNDHFGFRLARSQ